MPGNRLAEEAWESLARAQVALMRRFQEDFREAEVSMRVYDVLFTLKRCPRGRARLRDLNDSILLTQPSLSRLVERMEEQGLVERVAAIDRYVGGALTADELHTLRMLSDKLRAAQAGQSESSESTS
ncbi:Mn-dependent DtxR family transcriptional regulator [Spinactinospora alkalitolerans]|uniref:Mn-dependent DtxR family transcriptional regulator n=1 Tax=Spinactinospora alkalitolerans TaxID=687207 RepID=A0A852TWX8_9ACTN|nr:helix-turn-helix domain-containing protein [Spinactinospora alkalitolerans]NYE47343.1 Mn-dependent DtxR family transcriptional regulator [Spinactinospora alkalitolerans]